MPKAPVNKNGLVLSRKHQIRFTGELLPMQPIAISETIDNFPDDHFWFGVLGTNRRHIDRTLRRVDVIDHFTACFLEVEYDDQPWPVENLHNSW
jgi:hypothetical protein